MEKKRKENERKYCNLKTEGNTLDAARRKRFRGRCSQGQSFDPRRRPSPQILDLQEILLENARRMSSSKYPIWGSYNFANRPLR